MARKKVVKSKAVVVEKISAIKRIYNAVKAWIVGNGIEGVVGLIAGFVLWTFGYKIYAGFAFGVFATRNWDLAKNWVSKLLSK
tara:strand:- start:292 stop:540 length:249 start_codon:yes stop_codon:yes gene_type:complete